MRTKRAMLHNLSVAAAVTLALLVTAAVTSAADTKKPNILIIWGDDIGYWNVSAYNQGMMGYKTPNIDRIAKEGALFHRLVWPAKLHRRSRCVHHRPVRLPHRPDQGRPAGCARKACRRAT